MVWWHLIINVKNNCIFWSQRALKSFVFLLQWNKSNHKRTSPSWMKQCATFHFFFFVFLFISFLSFLLLSSSQSLTDIGNVKKYRTCLRTFHVLQLTRPRNRHMAYILDNNVNNLSSLLNEENLVHELKSNTLKVKAL